RALTTDGEAASERVLHYQDGAHVESLDRERRALRLGMTVGFAAHATSRDYVRIWFAAQWRREDFDAVGAPAIRRSLFGTAGAADSGRVSGALTVASQNVPRHTLILHLEGARLRRPKFGEEFDLWTTQNGPRVFGIHQFTGWRMAWLGLEDRILVADEAWGLMGVGLAPFFDYGG